MEHFLLFWVVPASSTGNSHSGVCRRAIGMTVCTNAVRGSGRLGKRPPPRTILDNYRSASAALGGHTSRSVATTRGFPGSGPITFGDGQQGNDAYELTYTVRRG